MGQTIRFSTQPLCWYCLFKDAEKKAQTKKIVGCGKDKDSIHGNLMTRSHFGDLQFLHAMSGTEGVHPGATRAQVLDWLEFAWKVSSGEIKVDTFLRDIPIATIQEHFGCSGWRVVDLYILGYQDKLKRYLREIAFGSVLHTIQDSFAGAHATRELVAPGSSRLNSSMTLKVLKRRPDHSASAMKSQPHPWLGWPAACSGCLMRAGSRFLPRLGKFSRSSQYTRQSTVFPQGLPWWRALSYSSPKP